MDKLFTGKRIGIIGRGNIGGTLAKRLKDLGAEIVFLEGRGLEYSYLEMLVASKPDAVALAIPTNDEGEIATFFLLATSYIGIPTVTCEKGSLSYNMHVLHECMPYIWCSASAGGGTMLLDYLKTRQVNNGPVRIEMVINGTLNYILTRMEQGATVAEACGEAGKLGYAEPNAKNVPSLINGELADVVMKACATFNIALSQSKFITPLDVGSMTFDEGNLRRLDASDRAYRLVVTFSKHTVRTEVVDDFMSVSVSVGNNWHLSIGFRELVHTQRQHWLPSGVDNAICITEGENGECGRYTLTGPGAGPEPTVKAMVNDVKDIFGV